MREIESSERQGWERATSPAIWCTGRLVSDGRGWPVPLINGLVREKLGKLEKDERGFTDCMTLVKNEKKLGKETTIKCFIF